MNNAHQIAITDAEHYGDKWEGPAPFEIKVATMYVDGWSEAPVIVEVIEGTTPERAAYLLRQVADALERNGRMWLPRFDGIDFHGNSDDEKTREAYRQIGDLQGQIDAIRRSLPDDEGLPF